MLTYESELTPAEIRYALSNQYRRLGEIERLIQDSDEDLRRQIENHDLQLRAITAQITEIRTEIATTVESVIFNLDKHTNANRAEDYDPDRERVGTAPRLDERDMP